MKFLNDNAFVLELPSHTKTFGPVQKVAARKAVKEFAEADLKYLCGTNAIYTNMIRPNLNWKINFLDNVVQRGTILLGAGIGINRKQFNLYTSSLWKKVLSVTDLDYIGSRLHGGMYALQHKKRAIVISIDYRASNMLIDSNIVIDRKNSSAEDLENIINSRFGTRMEIPLDDIAKWKAQFEI